MPTLWAHTNYFANTSTAVTPAPSRGPMHYPGWQSSGFSVGSGLGGAADLWDRMADRWRWFWTLFRRTLRLDREKRGVVLKAVAALEHPAYPLARQSVRKTATTLSFNRPESWKDLSRELKSSAGVAENAYRHLEACRLLRANLINSTLTNPECNLLVELAYHGYTIYHAEKLGPRVEVSVQVRIGEAS